MPVCSHYSIQSLAGTTPTVVVGALCVFGVVTCWGGLSRIRQGRSVGTAGVAMIAAAVEGQALCQALCLFCVTQFSQHPFYRWMGVRPFRFSEVPQLE